MHRYDFKAHRLFVRAGLAPGVRVELDRGQVNYLVNVLRMKDGDELIVFNGRDGEWRASLATEGRRVQGLLVGASVRPQPAASDLHYLFAPLKQARLDYMVEKAVEMGVARLRPVLTQHGQVGRINRERMEANAIEAAEQCGILAIPAIDELASLADLVDGLDPGRRRPADRLLRRGSTRPATLTTCSPGSLPSPVALLVGPEGGFSAEERAGLLARPFVTPISLGPRILRADTAAVAALALVQAALGDWKNAVSAPSGADRPSSGPSRWPRLPVDGCAARLPPRFPWNVLNGPRRLRRDAD